MIISEFTILHLQAAASIFMGYDYFLSDDLKERANVVATDFAKIYRTQLDEKLMNQIGVFRSWLPTLFTGIFYAIFCFSLVGLMVSLIKINLGLVGPLIALMLLIPFIWYSKLAIDKIIDAFANGVLPFTFPALGRVIITFLLYSSKGTIAALGMLFLISSFVCRYLNYFYLQNLT
jgi:hypothetical protein